MICRSSAPAGPICRSVIALSAWMWMWSGPAADRCENKPAGDQHGERQRDRPREARQRG
jgi:hypothetical protein